MTTQTESDRDVSLDHVGYIVEDLDATSRFMAQLGFTQTIRADHTRTDASGALVSMGSSQHSIMLRNGYIELMQITDPAAGHQLARARNARYGLHVLAFGTADADASHTQCQAEGVAVSPVMQWARGVNEAGAKGMARFAYFGVADWQPRDPSYLCWVQHLTPELLRPLQLVQHANNAAGLAELHYRGPRNVVLEWASRLRRAGARLQEQNGDVMTLTLPNALLRIDIDERCQTLGPSTLVVDFSDCDGLRTRCRRQGVVCVERPGGALELDLSTDLGMHWICRPAQTGA